MRVIVQRVKKASVTVENKLISKIDNGLLVFVGIEDNDSTEDMDWLANKICNLRILDDSNKIMNLSILDTKGDILAVSQFTLMASTKKGNRPSYIKASKPDFALPMYEQFCNKLSKTIDKQVLKGVFGADMQIELINDGPVTISIDSKNKE